MSLPEIDDLSLDSLATMVREIALTMTSCMESLHLCKTQMCAQQSLHKVETTAAKDLLGGILSMLDDAIEEARSVVTFRKEDEVGIEVEDGDTSDKEDEPPEEYVGLGEDQISGATQSVATMTLHGPQNDVDMTDAHAVEVPTPQAVDHAHMDPNDNIHPAGSLCELLDQLVPELESDTKILVKLSFEIEGDPELEYVSPESGLVDMQCGLQLLHEELERLLADAGPWSER
ncbi:hypothetical protein LTR95_009898 [Oleoguttula sp. CCFEE 5521]